MGKIRIKALGGLEGEGPNLPAGRQGKKEKHDKKKGAKAPGLKGGERVVAVGVSVEDLEKEVSATPEASGSNKKKSKGKKVKEKTLSKRYKTNLTQVKKDTLYPLSKALELLKGFDKPRFDETVELHINVKEKGVSGQVVLPHGTGKKVRVVIADEALIEKVQAGKIDFDVLIAKPDMMAKLARVAKILGPKGLMPNPKAGTISTNPEEAIKKFTGGQVSYKTEAQAPIIHLSVGKLSFDNKQLSENINTILNSIGETRIVNVTLKSSMSPGIKLETASSN